MALYSLSSELILEILHDLSFSDLMSFYLCSRRLYTITQPLIYSTFTQTGQHALPNLLRSILARPQLATYIKNLDLSILGPTRSYSFSDIDTSFLSESDRACIRARLLSAGWSKEWVRDWVTRLTTDKDNWDAAAGLLICLCSQSLESIALHGGERIETKTLRSTLEYAASEPTYLPKLRRLSLSSTARKKFGDNLIFSQFLCPELLSSALKFQQWEEISLQGLRCPAPPKGGTQIAGTVAALLHSPPGPLPTKKLSFKDCQMNARVTEDFLSRFNSLTHFKYESETYVVSGTYLPDMHIKNALWNSRTTLTHLSLDPSEEWYEFARGSGPYEPVLGDMRAFTALRYLEVDDLMLTGGTLDIDDVGEDMQFYTSEKCIIFAHGFPHSLQTLVIQRWGRLEDFLPGPFEALLDAGMVARPRRVVGHRNCSWSTRIRFELRLTMWNE